MWLDVESNGGEGSPRGIASCSQRTDVGGDLLGSQKQKQAEGQQWLTTLPTVKESLRSTVADPTAHNEGANNPSLVDLTTAKK